MNPASDAGAAAAASPSPRQVALGLFVIAQLAFLVSSNLIGLYQDAQSRLESEAPAVAAVVERVAPGYGSRGGHSWKIPDELATPLRRWSQLTGQDQRWALFSPNVSKTTGFPAIVLYWGDTPTAAPALARPLALLNAGDGLQAAASAALLQLRADELEPAMLRLASAYLGPLASAGPLDRAAAEVLAERLQTRAAVPRMDLFLSDNEPPDPRRFFRVGLFRIRRYEGNVVLYLTQHEDESITAARERWGRSIREHLAENADQVLAYMKLRVAIYMQRHPDRPPPRQVLLVERVYGIRAPDDPAESCWTGPTTLPLARWQRDVTWDEGYRPLEGFDPVNERFESIRK